MVTLGQQHVNHHERENGILTGSQFTYPFVVYSTRTHTLP